MKNPAWDNLESRNEIRKAAFLLFRKIGYKTFTRTAFESKYELLGNQAVVVR